MPPLFRFGLPVAISAIEKCYFRRIHPVPFAWRNGNGPNRDAGDT